MYNFTVQYRLAMDLFTTKVQHMVLVVGTVFPCMKASRQSSLLRVSFCGEQRVYIGLNSFYCYLHFRQQLGQECAVISLYRCFENIFDILI